MSNYQSENHRNITHIKRATWLVRNHNCKRIKHVSYKVVHYLIDPLGTDLELELSTSLLTSALKFLRHS